MANRPNSADPDWFLDEDDDSDMLVPRADPPAAGVAYADIPRRSIAFLLDLIFIQIGSTVLLEIAAFISGSTILASSGLTDKVLGAWFGFGLPTLLVGIFELLVFVYFWRVYRASPGQIVMGLYTVRNADGDRLSKRRGAVRWIATFLPALVSAASSNLGVVWGFAIGAHSDQQGATGFATTLPMIWFVVVLITVIVNPKGRGLNDRLAGSVVVRRDA